MRTRTAGEARLRRAHERFRARGQEPWVALTAHEFGAGELIREASEGLDAKVQMMLHADVWTVERGGEVARVKDSRGMQLLARLVERPGEEIDVLALASDAGSSVEETSAGEMLDERARKAYRKRISELAAVIATGGPRTTAAEREKATLERELARATGLGGRARQAGSATERARTSVQRRLKDAIGRISEANPALGAVLERSTQTGTFCCFRKP